MSSKREKQRVWPAAGMLAISVLLHAAFLLLPLPGVRHETTLPEPSSLRVELVARPPSPKTPEETSPPPQPPESASEDPVEPNQLTPTENATIDEISSSEPAPESASPSPTAANADPASEAIRTQLLGAARKLGRESEKADDGQGMNYQSIPDLPSQPGWLHQYTGRVTASIDRWRGNDGSSNARIVTGSGQVICVRTRAPTTAEIFNPWMSTAVPMMSGCGREKPEAPDPNDPSVRWPVGDGE